MWAALRSRSSLLLSSSEASLINQSWKLGVSGYNYKLLSSSTVETINSEVLSLQEVEKILSDVRADNVTVVPIQKRCEWADFMVIATGRSAWHVKNIAQSLIYQAKQKQKGAKQLVLPSVEGQEGGKWIVVDSGKVIVHALDEKAREYFNLEGLWATEKSKKEVIQDLGTAFTKVRRKNNSKKPAQRSARV